MSFELFEMGKGNFGFFLEKDEFRIIWNEQGTFWSNNPRRGMDKDNLK